MTALRHPTNYCAAPMEKVDVRKTNEQLSMFSSNTDSDTSRSPRQIKAIEIKSSSVLAVTAVLHTNDLASLDVCLKHAAGPDGDFFSNDIAVIDLSELDVPASQMDWPAIIRLFHAYRLNPVMVRNAAHDMENDILANGLGLDEIGQARPMKPQLMEEAQAAQPLSPEPEVPPQAPQQSAPDSVLTPPQAMETMIIDTPVRSGSRIYAPNADVIITAVVNPGAEIIADGSIHVYAPLKGRALAGAKGNVNARIFALSMEAELVSIAGVYSTFEDGPDPRLKEQPTQIRLLGNKLDINPFTSTF